MGFATRTAIVQLNVTVLARFPTVPSNQSEERLHSL
jgi:hypothetical protein